MVPKVVTQHLDAFVPGPTLGVNFQYDVLSNGAQLCRCAPSCPFFAFEHNFVLVSQNLHGLLA
jgi:hypothetical protein